MDRVEHEARFGVAFHRPEDMGRRGDGGGAVTGDREKYEKWRNCAGRTSRDVALHCLKEVCLTRLGQAFRAYPLREYPMAASSTRRFGAAAGLAALAIVAVAAAPPRTAESPPAAASDIKFSDTRLKNGLRVIIS